MTTNNALVFFVLGLAMFFVPAELPHLFPANAGDGSCTSALWLGVMGGMNFLIGLMVAVHNETIRLHAAIETWEPFGRTFDLPEVRWSMPASLYVKAGGMAGNYAKAGRNWAPAAPEKMAA